jgi:hypothetical protein
MATSRRISSIPALIEHYENLYTNFIQEKTLDAGVNIEGVLTKDGGLFFNPADPTKGAIRWTGTDFEGLVSDGAAGFEWKSLTQTPATDKVYSVVTQANDFPAAGVFVRHDGTSWVLACADSDEHTATHFATGTGGSGTEFILYTLGEIDTSILLDSADGALIAGDYYFLSQDPLKAGQVTATAPTSGVAQLVLKVNTPVHSTLFIQPAYILPDGSMAADTIVEFTADHGVIVDGVLLKDGNVKIGSGALEEEGVLDYAANRLRYFDGTEWQILAAGADAKDGAVFITDVVPTGTGNCGSKVKTDGNYILSSFLTDTQLVTASVIALTGHTHWMPVITVNGLPVTITVTADKPFFTGTIQLDLTGEDEIVCLHEDGATSVVTINRETPPEIQTAIFTGNYPGSQTELKAGDTFQLQIVSDVAVTAVQVDNYGVSAGQSFTGLASNTTQTVTLTIANKGTALQALGAKVRVQKATGSWSEYYLTESAGSTDKVNLINLNNLYPTVSIGTITYPASQGALKDVEEATVANTIANFDTISYVSSNGQLTITNSTTMETPKTVTRLSGGYNISTNNLTITANRAANGSSSTQSTVVKIAHDTPTIAITLPAARLRSGGNNGTTAQNHTVTVTANQQLAAAPTVTAGSGTWQGGGFTGGPAVWTRSLQIHDNDAKGAFSFSSFSATNLAGVPVTAITSGASYTVGGFVSRVIPLVAFGDEADMNVAADTYSKITLSWNGNPAVTVRAAIDTPRVVANSWCLLSPIGTSPVTIRILDGDTTAVSQESYITIEEAV